MVWETVSRELYQGSNPYVVNGYIAGTTIPASIKITPADPLEYMDGVIDTNGDTYIQVSPSDGNHGNKDVIRIKNYEGEYKRIGVVQFDFKSMNISDLTDEQKEIIEELRNFEENQYPWEEVQE